MANKRIDELTAATPVVGDFVATTGVGGPATKATVQQAANAGLRLDTAVIETYTGTNYIPYNYAITPGIPTSRDGVLIAVSTAGVTVKKYDSVGGGLVTLTQSNLVGVDGNYQPQNMASITTLSTPLLAHVGDFYQPATMASLTALSAPLLAYVGSSYGPHTMASIATLSTPLLAYVGSSYAPNVMASLTTLSTPLLAYVGGTYSPNIMSSLTTLSTPLLAYVGSSYGPQDMASLTTLSAPLLAYVGGGYTPSTMASLTAISLPALTSVGVDLARTSFTNGRIAPFAMGALTTLTFPVIEVIGSSSSVSINLVSGTAALTTFTLGSTLRRVNGNVILTSCALLVASVDDLLVRLAALDGTGLTTAYSSKTVTITGTSATPSATGLAAKATLVARGCTVTHN